MPSYGPLWQCRLGLSIGAYGSPVPWAANEASDARLHPSASPRAVPFPRADAQSEMERLRRENEMLKARMGKQEL